MLYYGEYIDIRTEIVIICDENRFREIIIG